MNDLRKLSFSRKESIEEQKKLVREIFVSGKNELNVANSLDNVLENDLGIQGVKTNVSIRYLVDGLVDEEYKNSLATIFAELPVENLMNSKEFKERLGSKKVLNIESIPGQYDNVIDAVQQCLMLQTGNQNHNVRAFKTICFEGNISEENMQRIKKYLINPVEKHDVKLSDKILLRDLPSAENVRILEGFGQLDNEGLKNLIKEYGLAMNIDDIKFAQEYFVDKGRNLPDGRQGPSVAEIKVLDTYRSDHCRHTTFNTEIGKVEFDLDNAPGNLNKQFLKAIIEVQNKYENIRKELGRENKPNTLMELATIAKRYLQKNPQINPNINNLVDSEEVNACTFRTTIEMEDGTSEEWEIQFKNETHNHPTEIEPFGGAATCLGGCIRDPLSGRTWIFQAMRVTGSADPTEPVSTTLAGKLSQKVISQLAALGYSSYGNQIGIHAGEVREYFHPGYKAKRFEVGYVIAGAPASNIKRERPKKGDKVIMIGGRTGRDGIGGATGSSKEHDSKSVANLGAEVQKGNPVEERKLTRLFLDSKFSKLIKRCNDFGAGGVAVAVGELSRGLDIDLDIVKTKYSGLDATELAISESQERMAIVIDPNDYDEVMKLIDEYNTEGVEIASITDDIENSSNDKLVMKRRGEKIVDLDRNFLDMAGAKRKMDKIKISYNGIGFPTIHSKIDNTRLWCMDRDEGWSFGTLFVENLNFLDVSSQKGLGSIFDNSVGTGNVLAMYGGKYQETPSIGMVSKIPTFNGVDAKTVAISTHGYNPDLAQESAYLGAINAIRLAISKQVALGGDYKTIWLTLQEYFGKLKDDPEKWGECYAALLGAFEAQIELGIPAIGGKDSMSGTYKTADGKEINVPPAVVAFAANTGDINKIVSCEFKKEGSDVRYFRIPKYFPGHEKENWNRYKKILELVKKLIDEGHVLSSNVVEAGGLAASIAKMSFGNKIGFKYNEKHYYGENNSKHLYFNKSYWFDPELGGIVLETDLSPQKALDLGHDMKNYDFVGRTTDDGKINIGRDVIDINHALSAYKGTFEKVFPTQGGGEKVNLIESSDKAKTRHEIIQISSDGLQKNFDILKGIKPKVLIPVFPGTNSELDTAHRVRQAGMEAEEFIFNNQSPEKLLESTKQFAELLQDTQMVVFPGGFSAGDQPHGSAKFIASIFRMNVVRDAMQRFLDKPDTLTLGICNGFQALIKLGVFDEGKISDYLRDNSPTLTYNTTGRHMTDQVGLNIISVLSPMLSLVNIGDTFVIPISHGEGRIYMKDQKTLKKYINNGQVVMQYLDIDGNSTSEFNGSLEGIAALCSPDGRILGMMPHPERTGKKLFQNIPGNHDLPIFKSAAKTFGIK